MNKFEKGEQPCGFYTPQIDGNEYGTWENQHECMRCEGSIVSFCLNCYRDHHANGYETCKRESSEH